VIGNRTRVKVVKNKLAPPFKEVEFDILYGEGISKEGDLLDAATNANLVEKAGSWFSYKDERIGQGRDTAIKWLKDHPEIVKTLRTELFAKAGIGTKPIQPETGLAATEAKAVAAKAVAASNAAATPKMAHQAAAPTKEAATKAPPKK
jgi:recombination protein RecA